ncbi:MAG: phytoene synthase [Gammaproteobacteria bacterium]|nr:MAG: phytoene synthase [Gammaproteobacteria bacterium]
MNPERHCRRLAAASGSNFHLAFRFLPAPQRRAITALYAFCRLVDDAVDDEAGDGARRLAEWRAELDRLYAGRPTHPVTQALAEAVARYGLDRAYFEELLDGMAMDLQHTRYPDFKALQLYCYRVASVVGILCAHVFGFSDRRTLDYAHDLGLALQLINILRDAGEDARRGRIYIPQDELAAFGVRPEALQRRHTTPALQALFAHQARRARAGLENARRKLPEADRLRQRPGMVMAALYEALLDRIERGGYRVLEQRHRLPTVNKLVVAWRAWRHAGRPADRRGATT